MLGPRCRVRPPLCLPGRTVWAQGRWRALRLRLLPDHGQRGRFFKLLWRFSPGPLRGRRQMKTEKWVGSRQSNRRWFRHLGRPASWILSAGQMRRRHRLSSGWKGCGERDDKEWIFLPNSLVGETKPLTARYTYIHVQSLENKCEQSNFLLIFWEREILKS